ncbi:MAG: Ig-like domain-containing protein, partial [Proteobacteria bacterium]|nr:Ig-like domain-containing protein [Pseudomonadota bacterium]
TVAVTAPTTGSFVADTTPTVTFSAEVGATTTCSTDGGAFVACTAPSFVTAALTQGAHAVVVKAVDAAGNQTTATTGSFTVDTVAPTITISTPPPANTNDNTPTLSTVVTGGPATLTCKVDAGAFVACTSPFTPAALGEGAHTITIRATDGAGNVGSDAVTFTVDTVPPTLTLDSQPPTFTNDTTPSVSFTATGATGTTCQVDSGTTSACTSPFTSAALAEGAHTITVVASDAATNATTKTASFTIDTTAPTVSVTAGPRFGFPTGVNPQTFTFTHTGASVQCKVNAGAFGACSTATTHTTGTLTTGLQTITIRSTDAAGNAADAVVTNDLDPTVNCQNGTSDHGDTIVTGLVEDLTTATVEFWFRSKDAVSSQQMWGLDTPSAYPNTPAVAVTYTAAGIVVMVDARHNVTQNGALNQRSFVPAAAYSVLDWHHYAVVFSGTTQKLFIDGVEVTAATQTGGSQATTIATALSMIGVPVHMHLGYFARDATSYANGALLDLRISNAALSGAPVYPQVSIASTVLLYPLDEGAGTSSLETLDPMTHVLTWTSASWGVCF